MASRPISRPPRHTLGRVVSVPAVGATPQFIAGLVVAQAALVSLMAYLTALATESIYAWWTSGPFPPLSLAAGMGLILLSAGCLGAMVPALAAARHDPLLEVRVP